MTFLFEAATHICSSLSIEKSLQQGFEFLRKQIPLDGIYSDIFIVDEGKMRFLAHVNENESSQLSLTINIPPHLAATLKDPKRQQIFRVDDIHEDPVTAYSSTQLVPDIRSFVIMRLELDKQHLGVIIFYSKKRAAFTEAHQQLLWQLHAPFALMTANAIYPILSTMNQTLREENSSLQNKLLRIKNAPLKNMVGSNGGLKCVTQQIEQVAPYDVTVLINGETGTGKEIITNTIHQLSPRAHAPLIKVNCGAIPETLFDSEFFGYEKGAFTDARQAHQGFFEQANRGTLFLDEIGELSLTGQVRLLRVLQNKVITRIGGQLPIKLDVRIIVATNRNLYEMVQNKLFREDLWYRLNLFPITLPPLRQRLEDIPDLIDYFVQLFCQKYDFNAPILLTDLLINKAVAYSWPGNIRELENMVERVILRLPKAENSNKLFEQLFIKELEANLHLSIEPAGALRGYTLSEFTSDYLSRVLEECNGKVYGEGGAAEKLGLPPSTLRSKMKKLGININNKK